MTLSCYIVPTVNIGHAPQVLYIWGWVTAEVTGILMPLSPSIGFGIDCSYCINIARAATDGTCQVQEV